MNREKIKLTYNISSWSKLKFNFWGITKAGNTSIKYLLHQKSENDMRTDDNTNQWVHHIKNTQYITPEEAVQNGFNNFTITRNPYDRFESMFKDVQRRSGLMGMSHCKTPEQFIAFLEETPDEKRNVHFRSQCYFIKNSDILHMDINDTEKLSNFFECEIPHKNYIKESIKIDNKLRERVYKVYSNDFKKIRI